MVAVNKTQSLWSKRLPVLARQGGRLEGSGSVTPACCWLYCNVCCWVVAC